MTSADLPALDVAADELAMFGTLAHAQVARRRVGSALDHQHVLCTCVRQAAIVVEQTPVGRMTQTLATR